MANVSYKSLDKVAGPLIFVKGVDNAAYGEMVEIKLENGERRQGQVLDTSLGLAVVQVFGQTLGLNTTGTSTTFLGETATLSVSDEMLGRVFDGLGNPKDNGPKIVSKEKFDLVGSSINPYSREEPSEFIQTGMSNIDGMNTLVRGQKLPIFSASGLPHNLLAIYFKKMILKNALVVSPDMGGSLRAKKFASLLNIDFITLKKSRNRNTGKVQIHSSKADVRGKDLILVDDIISTGGSIIKAAQFLKRQKCKRLFVACTHGLFVEGAEKKIKKAGVSQIISTNTIPRSTSKVDVSGVIVESIQ